MSAIKLSGYKVTGYRMPVPGLLLDNLSNVVGAWSFRKIRAAYTGYCVKLRRSSDNATTDVSFDSNGVVSGNSSVSAGGNLTTWKGADTLYIDTWYGQGTLSNNLIQPSAADQPEFRITGGVGGKPVFYGDGTRGWMYNDTLRSFFSSTCLPSASFSVYKSDSGGTVFIGGFNKGSTSTNIQALPSVNSMINHQVSYRFDGGTAQVYTVVSSGNPSNFRYGGFSIDATSFYGQVGIVNNVTPGEVTNTGSVTPGTHSSDRFLLGARQISSGVISSVLSGYIHEYILFNAAKTSTDFLPIKNSVLNFYRS